DGKTVVAEGSELLGEQKGVFRFWDVGTGDELRTVKTEGTSGKQALTVSPDGKLLVGGKGSGLVGLWETATGKEVAHPAWYGHRGGVTCVAWPPEGKTVASGGEEGSLRLWDPGTSKEDRHAEGRAPVSAVAYSPDGKALAWGSLGALRLEDPATGKEL